MLGRFWAEAYRERTKIRIPALGPGRGVELIPRRRRDGLHERSCLSFGLKPGLRPPEGWSPKKGDSPRGVLGSGGRSNFQVTGQNNENKQPAKNGVHTPCYKNIDCGDPRAVFCVGSRSPEVDGRRSRRTVPKTKNKRVCHGLLRPGDLINSNSPAGDPREEEWGN